MTDTEILSALKDLLAPINNRLEDLEIKMDTLQLDNRRQHRQTQKDIQNLNDEVDTLIAVMEAKNILPRIKEQ